MRAQRRHQGHCFASVEPDSGIYSVGVKIWHRVYAEMEYKLIMVQSSDPVSEDDMILELVELKTLLETKMSRVLKEIQDGQKNKFTAEEYKQFLIGGVNKTVVKFDKGVYMTLSQAVMIPTQACSILKLMEKTSTYQDGACFDI